MSSKLHHCVVVCLDHQAQARVLQWPPMPAIAFKQALNNDLAGLVLGQLG